MNSYNITCDIKNSMKHKVRQVQIKQIDSHKVYSKRPPLALTQAHKHSLVNCVINQSVSSHATHAANGYLYIMREKQLFAIIFTDLHIYAKIFIIRQF